METVVTDIPALPLDLGIPAAPSPPPSETFPRSRRPLGGEVAVVAQEVRGPVPVHTASPAMQEAINVTRRLAATDVTVTLMGETGTGKDVFAHLIHDNSPRARQPFVVFDCGAVPPNLVESELFGHERGAFTGAHAEHMGAFERAHGGTLFLDEVGELPLPAQAKLLRVLEDRKVTRLGGDRAMEITARVVAATHRDLAKEVETGRFRQDLYYRLNVHTLKVPPLRERLTDIPALVDQLIQTISGRLRVRPKTVSPDTLAILAAYDWRRNNVRELRNCLERMMIASDASVINVSDVPSEIQGEDFEDGSDTPSVPGSLKALKSQAERQIVLAALEKHNWQVTRTAESLGLADHSSLLKIMRRHGLSKPANRER